MAPINPSPAHATNIDTFLKSVKSEPPNASAEKLVAYLQRRQISGPEACSKAVLSLFLRVVTKGNWQDANSLLERIQRLGRRLIAARPQELSIGNVARRTMGLIRDEAAQERNDDGTADDPTVTGTPKLEKHPPIPKPPQPSMPRPPTLSATGSFVPSQNLLHLLQNDPTAESEASASGETTPLAHNTLSASGREALRSELIDGINELLDEIAQADDQIAAFADAQIHPGETVMVYRPTPTVEKFLAKAATKRKFTVMIAGVDAPLRSGMGSDPKEKPYVTLRDRLAKLGSQSIVLAGGGMMQHMSVVTKVVLDARAIVPSGGVVAENGAGELARAARRSKRTVIVLGAVYKVAQAEPLGLQELLATSDGTSRVPGGRVLEGVEVRCPELQFMDPDRVDLYISNLGPHSKQQLQAIITDHYKKEDVNFC